MKTRRVSRLLVATAIALGSISVAAPVATAAETDCRKTIVHTLICYLVNTERIEDLLCAVSGDLCP